MFGTENTTVQRGTYAAPQIEHKSFLIISRIVWPESRKQNVVNWKKKKANVISICKKDSYLI